MDSHQGPSQGSRIASSMPIIDEASIPTQTSQIKHFSASNPFAGFRPVENIPSAPRPIGPPHQSTPTSSRHVAQSHRHALQQRNSFSSAQGSVQLPVSPLHGAPNHAQGFNMTTNASESSNMELALEPQQPPQHSAFPQHDYVALVANARDITSFMDSFPGHLQGMKFIKDPPDLDTWRNILFNVDEMITLSEEQ